MDRFESPAERAVREAQERGDFDNLPGAGKPLRDLGDPDDPDWWIKGFVEREKLDVGTVLPPTLALRREGEAFPESLLELRTELSVRKVLEDFNHRVKVDRLRPAVGRFPAPIARTVDVDEMVGRWCRLKADRRPVAEKRPDGEPAEDSAGSKPRGRLGRLCHAIAVWSGMAG